MNLLREFGEFVEHQRCEIARVRRAPLVERLDDLPSVAMSVFLLPALSRLNRPRTRDRRQPRLRASRVPKRRECRRCGGARVVPERQNQMGHSLIRRLRQTMPPKRLSRCDNERLDVGGLQAASKVVPVDASGRQEHPQPFQADLVFGQKLQVVPPTLWVHEITRHQPATPFPRRLATSVEALLHYAAYLGPVATGQGRLEPDSWREGL